MVADLLVEYVVSNVRVRRLEAVVDICRVVEGVVVEFRICRLVEVDSDI